MQLQRTSRKGTEQRIKYDNTIAKFETGRSYQNVVFARYHLKDEYFIDGDKNKSPDWKKLAKLGSNMTPAIRTVEDLKQFEWFRFEGKRDLPLHRSVEHATQEIKAAVAENRTPQKEAASILSREASPQQLLNFGR